jgi:Domain of unknown function (DUF4234)
MSAMEQPVRTSGNTGPLGQPRGIGFGILLVIVTFGFYSWYWVFKTQEEMKQHTGEAWGSETRFVPGERRQLVGR